MINLFLIKKNTDLSGSSKKLPLRHEKLLETLSQWGVVGEALQATLAIPDPDDTARLLARLSLHYPPAYRTFLLSMALEKITEIKDQGDCAETLLLLQPLWRLFPALVKQAKIIAEAISDPLHRAHALQRYGTILQCVHQDIIKEADLGTHQAWAPIVLSALVQEVRVTFTAENDLLASWASLLSNPCDSTFQALELQVVKERPMFTCTAALVLDALKEKEHLNYVYALIPHLYKVEPETLPILYRWRAGND